MLILSRTSSVSPLGGRILLGMFQAIALEAELERIRSAMEEQANAL